MTQEEISELCESMKSYLKWLKSLPVEEARIVSKQSLMGAGIIDENCELTEQYRNK